MFRSNAVPAPSEVIATSEQRLIEATVQLIRGARQRVQTLGLSATNLADRVFGPIPQAVSGGATKAAEPTTAQQVLEAELRELHDAIDYLDSNINRLERIA